MPVEPMVVEVVRGGVVESVHRVHAVAVRDGRVEERAGDPDLVAFFRSAAKPIQALPVVRARSDLTDEEITIACASHLARPEQVAHVQSLLAKALATEADLECGPQPTRLEHNCSGKHAAMLALCRVNGWPLTGYRLPGHRCQRAMLAEVAAAADVDPGTFPSAVDGCGVVTFALPLRAMAHAFARLSALAGGAHVVRAMRAHPALVRGPGAADTELMRLLPGWVAKGGAEGLLCASGPDSLGVALKVEDGASRAVRVALAAFLGRLGIATGDLGVVTIDNSRGEPVGALVAR